MKREHVDFFIIPDEQLAIHAQLENWARWVTPRLHFDRGLMLWRMGKSNGRQWHAPEIRDSTDPLAAMAMEKAVYRLAEPYRQAVRWAYVYRTPPARACRKLGVGMDRLAELVRMGRNMLDRSCKT